MSVAANSPVTSSNVNTNFMSRSAATTSTISATTFSNTTESTTKDTGAVIVEGGVGIEKNLNVGGSLVVTGDLTVQGTTTTLNTITMELEDPNILINNGGDNTTAEGAGITIERAGTNGSLKYEDALASKFKVGALGSESEVLTASTTQVVTGNKDFSGNIKTDVIAESTSSAGVTIDGVLIKDGLTDGVDVSAHAADATIHFTEGSISHANIQNIGTNTHAQIDTHIGSTSNPHSVTKTQVSLGNVTDDAQLKRAASDINSFTEKTTPVNADIVLIEDSADSYNKKKVQLSNLGLGGASTTTPTVQRFTSGSGTYTTPASVVYLKIKMVAGGAGGAGSGIPSAQGGTSSAGGNTTFGTSLLTANGGAACGPTGTGSAGGTCTTSSPAISLVNIQGGYGGSYQQSTPTTVYISGGHGGVSFFGGAGSSAAGGYGSSNAIANSGSGGAGGGGGGAADTQTGPGGGAGGYIEAIINSPSATYSYAVGAGGAGGSAGTSGYAGSNGGSGIIIVEEYY